MPDHSNTANEITDPVCGMHVANDAEPHIEYHGVTYRFCEPACAETFRDEPERWVGGGDQQGFAHSHNPRNATTTVAS